jgi:hypothetical protein
LLCPWFWAGQGGESRKVVVVPANTNAGSHNHRP